MSLRFSLSYGKIFKNSTRLVKNSVLVEQLDPLLPLLLPIHTPQYFPQFSGADRLPTDFGLHGEDLLLNLRGQEQKVHDLGESGAGELVV